MFIRWRNHRNLKSQIKTLKRENRLLKEAMLDTPNITCIGGMLFLRRHDGKYRIFREEGTTWTPMG